MKLNTNEKQIVEFLLQCQPGHPCATGVWRVDHKGLPFNLPSIGGITLNMQVGDTVFGWAGDHLEPGVSATSNGSEPHKYPNPSLQFHACVGNTAKVISGSAKGAKGVVIGHHGGSEHVIIDFPRKVKEKLTYDDKILITSHGQGLKLNDFPEIDLMNLDPKLLKKLKIKILKNKKLQIPVTTLVPAECMGSGLGTTTSHRGDYDIMTSDPLTVKKYNLDKMRFGDFVAILDHHNSYGPTFKKGAISIGIIVHSDCLNSGHGPGVTTIICSSKNLIEPIIDSKANIADILKIGTFKK